VKDLDTIIKSIANNLISITLADHWNPAVNVSKSQISQHRTIMAGAAVP
jgi:hypothetical protein